MGTEDKNQSMLHGAGSRVLEQQPHGAYQFYSRGSYGLHGCAPENREADVAKDRQSCGLSNVWEVCAGDGVFEKRLEALWKGLNRHLYR